MIGVGLSVGLAGAPQSGGAPAPNPNLLLWSEELQQAVWTATDCTVTANQANDSQGQPTLDRLAFAELGSIGQTADVAATAGATVTASPEINATPQTYTVTGTFDSSPYTFSVELSAAVELQIQIAILRSGGFLRVLIRDLNGEAPTIFAGRAKLEQSATATAYIKREGV